MNGAASNPDFSTTQWSVVLAAIHAEPERASAALEKLCGRYWYPVYAFVRQKGHDMHAAQDLTQGFFHFILDRQAFQQVDRQKGRFRSFMLAALTNFMHNERDKLQAHKRGGQYQIVSLDEETAEGIYRHEPADHTTPEKHFERSWAATLIRRVLAQLGKEHEERGSAALFAGIHPYLTGEPEAGAYDRVAAQLDLEVGALKVAVHRARRRFGELLRCEVAHTVRQPEEVEEEIRQLLAAIAE